MSQFLLIWGLNVVSCSLIAFHFQNSDGEQLHQKKINSTVLLKNCLQAAAARIYDESAEVDRATKRIEILLKWLPEDDSQETGLETSYIISVIKIKFYDFTF